MIIRRRDFLVGLGLAPLAAAVAHASAPVRGPYVQVGDLPDSLTFHLWDRPILPPRPLLVTKVLPWDGRGYPIVVATMGCREQDRVFYDGGYDHDWSVLNRDVPADFWRHPSSLNYANVHAFVREQRFGESPAVMRDIMERNRLEGPPSERVHAVPLLDRVEHNGMPSGGGPP
jgi:hypothetical protein